MERMGEASPDVQVSYDLGQNENTTGRCHGREREREGTRCAALVLANSRHVELHGSARTGLEREKAFQQTGIRIVPVLPDVYQTLQQTRIPIVPFLPDVDLLLEI